MEKKIIPVFFSFDDGYVPQAAVTFVSLLTNANKNVFYELYVVYSNISKENIVKLLKQVSFFDNAELNFVKIDDLLLNFDFNDSLFSTGHLGTVFTKDTLYRCIPDLISDFDKYDSIIYSDVDIVILDDISELIDVDLKNVYLSGVKTPRFLKNEIKHLDKKFEAKYFCGGLWVMNLNKMREDKIGNKVKEIIKNPPCRLIWNDQDVMNLACDTKVNYIPYTFISIPDWFPMLKNKNYKDSYYTRQELYECMHNPKIIHYAGKKPWKDLYTRKSDIWFYWLNLTLYKDIVYSFEEKELKIDTFKFIKYAIVIIMFKSPFLSWFVSSKKYHKAISKIQN